MGTGRGYCWERYVTDLHTGGVGVTVISLYTGAKAAFISCQDDSTLFREVEMGSAQVWFTVHQQLRVSDVSLGFLSITSPTRDDKTCRIDGSVHDPRLF